LTLICAAQIVRWFRFSRSAAVRSAFVGGWSGRLNMIDLIDWPDWLDLIGVLGWLDWRGWLERLDWAG
jgi:hypothetical protein